MLDGESDPPQASGVRWSTSYPGHLPLVLPVLGHGWFFLNTDFCFGSRFELLWLDDLEVE